MKKPTLKSYEWVCPECGKQLVALYELQLEQWRNAHLESHILKQKKGELQCI